MVEHDSWLTTALLFIAALALYLATLAPTIYNLDSAEFSTAAWSGGLVRATGYPLYLMVGRVWSRIPLGDVGFRMNALSALCGALTLGLAHRILLRLGVGVWATIGALGLLAVSRFFWGLSLIAEVYTPHAAFVAGILLALLRWGERPGTGRLALVALVMGLSAAHHMATVLLAPGVVWYVLRVAGVRALHPRNVGAVLGALAAGLSIYLYLPWTYLQEPLFNYAGRYDDRGVFQPIDLTTREGLWWLISGKTFESRMWAYGPIGFLRETGRFVGELWRTFVSVGFIPGVVGLIALWRRHRREAELLVLVFACHTLFYVNYAVADRSTMFLPSYLIWALWLAFGYQWLLGWVRDHPDTLYIESAGLGVALLRGLVVGGALLGLVWNGPLVDLSEDWSTRQRGELILDIAEPEALVVGWWDTVPVVEYLQFVEGRRPDIVALNRFLIDLPDLKRLVAREVGRRPVYFDEPAGKEFPDIESERLGPLYRLRARFDQSAVAQ